MSERVYATIAGLMVAVTLLLWPACYNHQPFFFPDTTAYVRGADAAVAKLTGVRSVWTKTTDSESADNALADKSVLAGRSVYYGALVYLGDRGGGEWLSIVIQAALLVLALFAILQAFDIGRWPYLLVLVAALAAFTLLPLYVSFLMPDVFTGLTILACGILLTRDFGKSRVLTVAWFALLTVSLTFHTTHVLLALLMFSVGLAAYLWRRSLVMPRGLMVIGVALGVAYLSGAAFTVAVTRIVGQPPLTPPFLMARLIDDGPGYDYLRDTCPGSGFLACRFVGRLPMLSDDFLWSKDPATGVFGVSDPTVRRGLSQEQYRFALAALVHEPFRLTAVSLVNMAEQVFMLKAYEFSYTPEEKSLFAQKLPEIYFAVMQSTPAFQGHLPLAFLDVVSYSSTAVGAGYLVFLGVSGRWRRVRCPPQFHRLVSWVMFGVLANAAVCGVMSGPHDRYQARVAWLLPALALIAHFQIYPTWWERRLQLRMSQPHG
jgi:hypothetical protein